MDALQRLEQSGYRFDVDGERLTYRYEPPTGRPMSEEPVKVQEVVSEWAAPLLAELGRNREAVVRRLRARLEWESVWDDWCAATQVHKENPVLDAEACVMADLRFSNRLNELAIAARFPFYNGGQVDLGVAGWLRFGTEFMREALQLAMRDDAGNPPAPDNGGPLVPCYMPEVSVSLSNRENKESDTMGILIQQTTFEVLPVGEYRVRIADISEVEGRFGAQLQFKVEVSDGPHAGSEFPVWCSKVFSPKSKLYQWVEAALAVPIPKEFTLNTDNLIGREVLATVLVKELEGGGEANRVERVRPVKAIQRQADF